MQKAIVLNEGLLDSVIEQLRKPLLSIQILAETGRTDKIAELTRSSLRLIEDLQYVRELSSNQAVLQLAPVNVAALSDDIAHSVSKLAQSKNVKLETLVSAKDPVLCHRETLLRAYENMARASIMLLAESDKATLTLLGSRQQDMTRLGVYSEGMAVAAKDLSRLRRLFGESRRPLGPHSASPVIELFLADRLFKVLGGTMRTSINLHRRGFATRLATSRQLALVS